MWSILSGLPPLIHGEQSDNVCEFHVLGAQPASSSLLLAKGTAFALVSSPSIFFLTPHPQAQPDGRCLAAGGPRCQILEYSFTTLASGFMADFLACTSANFFGYCLAGSCGTASGAVFRSSCFAVGWLSCSELLCWTPFSP